MTTVKLSAGLPLALAGAAIGAVGGAVAGKAVAQEWMRGEDQYNAMEFDVVTRPAGVSGGGGDDGTGAAAGPRSGAGGERDEIAEEAEGMTYTSLGAGMPAELGRGDMDDARVVTGGDHLAAGEGIISFGQAKANNGSRKQ